MTDEIDVSGIKYVSSKRAAQMSGYTQDYIGQLARAGQIDARRIGGLWYVSYSSLDSYKAKAAEFVPQLPAASNAYSGDMESFVGLDGNDYISSSRASEISGYAQDYIGQLARAGQVMARQVGNRWYVERASLSKHKHEKDSLLAAVQTESVGLDKQRAANTHASPEMDLMTYTTEHKSLHVGIGPKNPDIPAPEEKAWHQTSVTHSARTVPIRIVRAQTPSPVNVGDKSDRFSAPVRLRWVVPAAFTGVMATIVMLLTFGFTTIRSQSSYTVTNMPDVRALSALASHAVEATGDVLERWLTSEKVYHRTD